MSKILVCCTGSVATIKLPNIVQGLRSRNLEIKICCTEKAKYFCKELLKDIYTDEDEWAAWKGRGDPVLHIDLAKWADILLISPLDANTLAKISNGICDNMLTCVVRAWDMNKPLLFCPAMNTKMYEHPITQEQINKLKSWKYIEIPCISKVLMCGDTGKGAMAEPEDIVKIVMSYI